LGEIHRSPIEVKADVDIFAALISRFLLENNERSEYIFHNPERKRGIII